MSDFILASASPRRRQLLRGVGYDFEVIPSDADETLPADITPEQAVVLLAQRKAKSVAEKHSNTPTLGCDTIVVLDGKILGKPSNKNEAFKMLRSLSGRTHSVFTGVSIIQGEHELSFAQESRVQFFDLSDELIHSYIATGEPMDKAGAYGIQAFGAALVKKIDGDYFTVVGLPLARVMRTLIEFGVCSALNLSIAADL